MEKPRKVNLLGDRILVTELKKGEHRGSRTTPTGMLLTGEYIQEFSEGVVSHAGDWCEIKEGEIVLYRSGRADRKVLIEGGEYLLLEEEDIIAVIGERAPKKTIPTKLEK